MCSTRKEMANKKGTCYSADLIIAMWECPSEFAESSDNSKMQEIQTL